MPLQTDLAQAFLTAACRGKAKILIMNIVLNGESRTIEAPSSVADLIQALGYAGKRVAIERNGEIVPRSAHEQTLITDNDRVEIVVAVGGG